MSVGSNRVLDRLAAEEPCLGALFFTYGFDPSFFEDHVLRAVLRLSSDPTEQPTRYHDEAVRALQVTPVVVVADAGVRQGGRRLPYDVLDVSARVFHPKLALLVYADFARVHVGSGNLTGGGYGSNAELFVTIDLHYDRPSDAAVLDELLDCVARAVALARTPGTQYGLVLEALGLRPRASDHPAETSTTWLDSTRGTSILDQALALVPDGADIRRVGIMAPFFERDDRAGAESMRSLFGRLRAACGSEARLDVGVVWENPSVRPQAHSIPIEERLGSLWAWQVKDGAGHSTIEYVVPTRVARTRLHYEDESGHHQTCSLDMAREALERQTLWPVPEPIAFAPPDALASADSAFSAMQLWLYPATRLVDGRPLHRPLHAKLLTLQYVLGGREETLVIVGSANASRNAMLRTTADHGNVELCLAFRVARAVSIKDVAPELVAFRLAGAQVIEREFPELGTNWGLAIRSATYDAATTTLTVAWAQDPELELPAWSLTYRDDVIASGAAGPMEHDTLVHDFALHRSSAELSLVVGDSAHPIPILVSNLVALPVGEGEGLLGLHELLLMLGRRMGRERVLLLAEQRAASLADGEGGLDDVFGAGFGPTDVFKAWWSVAEELANPETSVAAFRLRIEGSLGVAAVWTRMVEATRGDSPYTPETIWFYGAELHRELTGVHLSQDAAGAKKAETLDAFLRRLRADLAELVDSAPNCGWLARVVSFYGVAE